jgi:hypothetical protein
MNSRTHLIALVVIALTAGACDRTTVARTSSASAACRAGGPVARLAELPEASGLALSQRIPGHLWTHNDSDQPILFILDGRGSMTGRVRLAGATVVDWEAVAVGPCPTGSCIFVGDIGDNNARRERITVYRLTEPAGANTAVPAEAFHATYPDGPQDAETLLVPPDGGIYIVTKGSTGPVALYRFPRGPSGTSVRLERVGTPRSTGRVADDEEITDGAVSPDGARIVLRAHHALFFYRTSELLAGNWREEQIADLTQVAEPQGEGVTFGPDHSVYLSGEGGGGSRAGTFARVTCPDR